MSFCSFLLWVDFYNCCIRFINERIESLAISLSKSSKGATTARVTSQSKSNGSTRISSDHFSRFVDPSGKGVELVQFKKDQPETVEEKSAADYGNGTLVSKDPLLSVDTRSTRSWSSIPSGPQNDDEEDTQRHHSGGEWGDVLDKMSRRKTEALAPEHFENMWTKGRNYRRKEDSNQVSEPVTKSSLPTIRTPNNSKALSRQKGKDGSTKISSSSERSVVLPGPTDKPPEDNLCPRNNMNISSQTFVRSYVDDNEDNLMHLKDIESESSSSCTCEDEETSSVTGLDSPGTIVWDGKHNRKLPVSNIHHPLESVEGRKTRKTGKGHAHSRLHRTQPGRRRSRLSSQKLHVWQEVERTS